MDGHTDKRNRDKKCDRGATRPYRPRWGSYHELVGSIEEVYLSSREEVAYKSPNPIRGKVPERHKDKFCLYHNAAGHTTASCFNLKEEIESLIRDGYLREYRKYGGGPQMGQTDRIEGEIHLIAGGPYLDGESR